jgi:hypothetical protein
VFDQAKQDPLHEIRNRNRFEETVHADTKWEVHCIRASEVSGRIVDADGHGVAGANMHLMTYDQDGKPVDFAWAVSDRDGLFLLPHLNGTGERESWLEFTSRKGDGSSKRFRMGVGKAIPLGDLKATPPAVIEGVVRDHTGAPVPGASLRLVRRSQEADLTISDSEGRFHLVGGAGDYRLICHCGHEKDSGRWGDPVTLHSGEKLQHDFVRERR